MEKKNAKIAVASERARDLTADKAEARQLNGQAKDQRSPEERVGMAAVVARNTTHVRNWKFKNADKHFPHEPLLRRVDKYFQYAHGGPLFVDEPIAELEIQQCKRKAEVMKAEGLRYCYIAKEMSLPDVMKQLEEPKGKSA